MVGMLSSAISYPEQTKAMITNVIVLSGVAQITNVTGTLLSNPASSEANSASPGIAAMVAVIVALVFAVFAGLSVASAVVDFSKNHIQPLPIPLTEFRAFLGSSSALAFGIILLFVGIADGMFNCIPRLEPDKILAAGVALFLAGLGAKKKE
jgi:hypothetical protein